MDKEAMDSAARRELSQFLGKHLPAGTGNVDRSGKIIGHWSNAQFARKTGIAPSRLSVLRAGTQSPSLLNLDQFEAGFFPHSARDPSNPAYRDWLRVRALFGTGEAPADIDTQRYTAREVWNLLLKPVRQNSTSVIRESGGRGISPWFDLSHIEFRVVQAAFILDVPPWFRDWAHGPGRGQYELHEPVDLGGSKHLEGFYRWVPVPNLRELVARHADAYAREVQATLLTGSAFPPYNKEKLGLFSFQQPTPAGKPERAYMAFQLFRTDYFTHRVMRRVLHEIRPRYQSWFDAKGSFIEEAGDFLRYFMTSFGLNLLVTTRDKPVRNFHMVRLAGRQGNENQRRTLHVSANEGLNLADVSGATLDLDLATRRTLEEELGITSPAQIESTVYIEFAMELANFEPYLLGLTHLAIDSHALAITKAEHARDDRRETTEILAFPFTKRGIIDMLVDNPRGSADFSTFALPAMDAILSRGLTG